MARREQFSGFWSTHTQIVANELPQWHVIRTDPTSKGQKFLNIAGAPLEYQHMMLMEARKNAFIGTADTRARWDGYGLGLPQGLILRQVRQANLLSNSSLVEQGIAHRKLPLWWSGQNTTHYPDDSKYGHGCMKMVVANGETGLFSQEIDGEFESGRRYTASVYVKGAGAYTGEDPGFTLSASATAWTTAAGSVSEDMAWATANEWRQYTATVTLSERSNKLSFDIQWVNGSGSEGTVKISAPQISPGTSPQPWQPESADLLGQSFRLAMYGPTGEEQQKIELRPKFVLTDFYEDALPTRCTPTFGHTGELVSFNDGPRYQEWNKQEWETGFRLGASEDIEFFNRNLPAEVIETFRVADRYPGNEPGTGEYGFIADEEGDYSRTWEAMTVWRRRIYALCLETKAGETYRTLKVISSFGLSGEMEVIGDVLIGMDTGEATYLGFRDGRMEQMVMGLSDDTYWTLSMFFDYYYLDSETRQILVRHPYTGMTPTFIEF